MEKKQPWFSKRFWGLAIAAVGVFAPKYQPLAEAIPTVVFQLGQLGGFLLAAYGSAKAKGPWTLTNPQE